MKIEITNRDEWRHKTNLIIKDISKTRKERIAAWKAKVAARGFWERFFSSELSDNMESYCSYVYGEDTYDVAVKLLAVCNDPNTNVIFLSDREYTLLTSWYEDIINAEQE